MGWAREALAAATPTERPAPQPNAIPLPLGFPPHSYLLRVTVVGKGMVADVKRDFPFWVRNSEPPPPPDAPPPAPIKMEVGIEDCLHIEFEYDRGRYHLKDCVVGRIHFLLVGVSRGGWGWGAGFFGGGACVKGGRLL